jgi:hypothetical protein
MIQMADDKMKNDDRQRNMGTTGREDQELGKGQRQQTPGRNPQGGQQGGQYGGQQGQQKEPRKMDDEEEFGGGATGQRGGQGRGGQNR